jgi:hypothetical protein
MAYSVEDVIGAIRISRRYLLRHLEAMREDQWDWSPAAPCKTARETLAHLVCDDRALALSLETNAEPDYGTVREDERDIAKLLTLLDESHERVVNAIRSRFSAVDDEGWIWSKRSTLAAAAPMLCSEDYYHAGQLATIRMATDPSWDFLYYDEVYS